MTPWHILNTRPPERAAALTQALQQAGHRVSVLPLLAFQGTDLSDAQQAALHQTQAGDVVIVVSPTAAQLGLAWIAQHPSAIWQQVRWFAVGEATAQVLAQAGFDAQIPTRANSEGLLVLPDIAQIQAPTRVLVWRGEGGRELIQQTLLQRGVVLKTVEFYRRILPPESIEQWRACVAEQRPNAVLISSGDAWQHWCALAGAFAHVPTCLVYGEHLQQRLATQVPMVRLSSLQPQAVVAALAAVPQPIGERSCDNG